MPKIIKKRIVKKAKPQEEIETIVRSTKGLISKKQRTLLPAIAIIAGLIILIIGGILIYWSTQTKRAKALEYNAYKTFYGLYQKQPTDQTSRYQEALDKFKKAYSLRKSPYCLFYIANCYYGLGKFDDALKTLKDLNQRFPDDENFVPLSYYKIAMINLHKGDKEGAIKSLETLYNYKTGSFKDLALIESARILEGMGREEESTKKYEALVKNFPNSPFLQEARSKLSK